VRGGKIAIDAKVMEGVQAGEHPAKVTVLESLFAKVASKFRLRLYKNAY
jgi:hypothetical protein